MRLKRFRRPLTETRRAGRRSSRPTPNQGCGAAGDGAADVAAQVVGTQGAFVLGGVLGLVAVVFAPFVGRLREVDSAR